VHGIPPELNRCKTSPDTDACLSTDIFEPMMSSGMSFGEGVSGISKNVAAHPTRGWSQQQQ
jgi:hypothetical protein